MKRVVVIGGGTGTYTVLSGLKSYPLELSAIVSMTDSGGSNRVLRDEFGLLPTSDIRQCMLALSSNDSDETMRKLFTYRYNQGTGISGMTFGNLFMAALSDIYGSQDKALQKTCQLLGVRGSVIPVTFDDVHLVARYSNGKQIVGERFIDEPDGEMGKHRIVELETIPRAVANKKVLDAIERADLIIFGPGDLYTSVICNLVIDGVSEAVRKSKAKKLFIINLMTKFGQTNNFTASDFVKELEKYLGSGVIDICLVNKTDKFPESILKKYEEERASPVKDDLQSSEGLKVVRRSLVSSKIYKKPKGDVLHRSLIRHDSKKLARVVVSLIE